MPRAAAADPRPAPSPFRRFGASIGATPVPIGPAVLALCAEMLGHTDTDTLTKHDPANFFFSDPPEEIFVHKNMLCRLGIGTFYSLRFWTRGRHCLALPLAKIVDKAKIQFNKGLVFCAAKVPYQFARAHVLHAPNHIVTFAIYICSRKLIIVPIFTSLLGQSFPKSEDPQPTRTMHVNYAPQTTHVMHHRIALVELYQFTKFHVPSSKVPESKSAYANV